VAYKVLIVDDSKLARMGVTRAMKLLHPDWESMEASNADEALELVKNTRPHFVLMDYNMPGKDGITLASELRALDAEMGIAVISANQQIEVINRARAAGAHFLPKPLTEAALGEFFTTALAAFNGTEK